VGIRAAKARSNEEVRSSAKGRQRENNAAALLGLCTAVVEKLKCSFRICWHSMVYDGAAPGIEDKEIARGTVAPVDQEHNLISRLFERFDGLDPHRFAAWQTLEDIVG
jgi:hypothetical protein